MYTIILKVNMSIAVVHLLGIFKLAPQPIIGSVRFYFTTFIFLGLTRLYTDSGSLDFICLPETKDVLTQECFSRYAAEMSSFMHPYFFVIITAVALFVLWSAIILYGSKQIQKLKRTAVTAINERKHLCDEFWEKFLLHVRCEAVVIIFILGLFCCTQKICFAETYNSILRNTTVEIVFTCRDRHQRDKSDLNVYFIGGMASILLLCMWVICHAKNYKGDFKELVDLTVTENKAGKERLEFLILNH